MSKDNLGDRMKSYENVTRNKLTKRMPLIIRIDGCHFHTYTKGMTKPFDKQLTQAFWETSKYLAQQIQGCKLVYHQSDEISLLLTNYDKLTTESWFDNNVLKMASVSASLATAKFNEEMRKMYPDKPLATFDSRVWLLPHEEVGNYFWWRMQDAMKNSISMVAQANFSHQSLQGLQSQELQEKLVAEKGIHWCDLPVWQKRGVCIVKKEVEKEVTYNDQTFSVLRKVWDVDYATPVFAKDKSYIEQHVYLK